MMVAWTHFTSLLFFFRLKHVIWRIESYAIKVCFILCSVSSLGLLTNCKDAPFLILSDLACIFIGFIFKQGTSHTLFLLQYPHVSLALPSRPLFYHNNVKCMSAMVAWKKWLQSITTSLVNKAVIMCHIHLPQWTHTQMMVNTVRVFFCHTIMQPTFWVSPGVCFFYTFISVTPLLLLSTGKGLMMNVPCVRLQFTDSCTPQLLL